MVDVSHNGHDRGTSDLDIIRIGGYQLLKFLFNDHFFKWHEAEIKALIKSHFGRHSLADGLIKRCKNTAFDQELHHVTGGNTESFGKFADGCSFNKPYGLQVPGVDSPDLIEDPLLDRTLLRNIQVALDRGA